MIWKGNDDVLDVLRYALSACIEDRNFGVDEKRNYESFYTNEELRELHKNEKNPKP